MRIKRDSAQGTLDHARSYLGALADEGQQSISIRRAMELLGVKWQDPQPGRVVIDPGSDPMTGCKPVTARQDT